MTNSPRRITIEVPEPNLSPQSIALPLSPQPIDFVDELGENSVSRRDSLQKSLSSKIHVRAVTHQPPSRPRSRPQSPASTNRARIPLYSSLSSAAPLMQRAHSSPGIDGTGRTMSLPQHRPTSPLHSGRRESPLRGTTEEIYPLTFPMEPDIPEHEELDLSEQFPSEASLDQLMPLPSYHNTFPRSRRRPTSPLHSSASSPSLYSNARASSPHTIYPGRRSTSGTTSPVSMSRGFGNEPYPTSLSYSTTSSMPSTPSSFRSRSPSISSLDTLEESPDAEEAARLEDEEEAKNRSEGELGELKKRSSSLSERGGLKSDRARKRWSVCGAERRADFSLEVIEE